MARPLLMTIFPNDRDPTLQQHSSPSPDQNNKHRENAPFLRGESAEGDILKGHSAI